MQRIYLTWLLMGMVAYATESELSAPEKIVFSSHCKGRGMWYLDIWSMDISFSSWSEYVVFSADIDVMSILGPLSGHTVHVNDVHGRLYQTDWARLRPRFMVQGTARDMGMPPPPPTTNFDIFT